MKNNWQEVKLDNVCELIAGFAFKSKDFGAYPDKVVKITNIEPPFVNMTNLVGVDLSKYNRNNLAKFIVKRGDYVLAMTGATIGKLGRISNDDIAYINQRVLKFKPNDGVDKDFLFFILSESNFSQYILNHIDSESAQANISAKTIGQYEFELPPLDAQKRISAVLGSLDNKIELNNKINQNLEAQAQAIFKSWFVDFEPFGGKMPKDWAKINLSDIADFVGGYSYKSNELQHSSDAMATIKNFDRNGGFKLDGFKEIIPSSKLKDIQKVDLFDTLVAHTDLTQNADVIGNAEMLLSKARYSNIIISMDVVKVIPKNGLSKFLLAALLKDARFKKHCLCYVNGTTVLHLSKKALPEYIFAFPNNVENVCDITNLLEGIYRKMARNIEENTRLSELRDTLLPKLMSGEIDVSDVAV